MYVQLKAYSNGTRKTLRETKDDRKNDTVEEMVQKTIQAITKFNNGTTSLCAGLSEKGLDIVNVVIQVVNSSGFIRSTFILKVNSVLFRLACIQIFNNLFASYLLFYLMDSGQV